MTMRFAMVVTIGLEILSGIICFPSRFCDA
jgi:hypothetical protein